MNARRGFAFALEAAMGLLALAVFLHALSNAPENLPSKGLGEVAQYQALQDLLEISVRNYAPELEAASLGDEIALGELEEAYSRLVPEIGNYCLKVEIEGAQKNATANCPSAENSERGSSASFKAHRLLFNGEKFFAITGTIQKN